MVTGFTTTENKLVSKLLEGLDAANDAIHDLRSLGARIRLEVSNDDPEGKTVFLDKVISKEEETTPETDKFLLRATIWKKL